LQPALRGQHHLLQLARAGELQEVVLTTEGGLQWVGLTPPGGALRRGALARAVVDPAAVVLGSAD